MISKKKATGIHALYIRRKQNGYASHDDNMPENEYIEFMRLVFGECLRVCKGLVWVNHKTKFRNKLGLHPLRILPFDFHSEIVWARPGSLIFNAKRYAPSHEFIYGFGVPHFWDPRNDMKLTVWRIAPENKVKGHPCPFPVIIPQRCIESSCPPNGVVIDPFMGSGSSGIAAIETGRKFIGIEKDPGYFALAKSRIQQRLRSARQETKCVR